MMDECTAIHNELNAHEWKLITNSINAYMISEAVYAACELSVFDVIETLPDSTLENIAHAIHLDEYRSGILLMCLCASSLVYKDLTTNTYHNHSAASKALCRHKINNFTPFVRFNHQIQQKGMFYFLEALKSGKNVGLNFLPGNAENLYDRLAESAGLSELFHEGMVAYTHFGPKIVSFAEMAGCRRLLDIGGGKGNVSVQYLKTFHAMTSIVMDIPEVCKMGQSLNTTFSDRLAFIAGDIFTHTWEFQQDAILFSHILEIFSLEKINFLYKKAYAALPSGGKLFVWTIVANDNETGSLQAAKSSAYFLTMASGEGKTYSKKTHFQIGETVGFKNIAVYDRMEYDHVGLVFEKL